MAALAAPMVLAFYGHGTSNTASAVFIQELTAQARASHDDRALGELAALAPYPRADGSVSVDQIVKQCGWVIRYGGTTWGRTDFDYAQDYTRHELSPEEGIGESLGRLLPTMMAGDACSVRRLGCPMFIFAGAHDYETPSSLNIDWLVALNAPRKGLVRFENSAHAM